MTDTPSSDTYSGHRAEVAPGLRLAYLHEDRGGRPLVLLHGYPETKPNPAARRLWVAGMYTSRLWASRGAFTRAELEFMTEPFGDEARLRTSWAPYQLAHGRPLSEIPLLQAPVDVPTLVLDGPEDHVVGPDFVRACELAFTNR